MIFVLYLLFVVDVLFITGCASTKSPFWGLLGMACLGFFLWLLDYPVVSFIRENWRNLIPAAIVYVVVGMPWALFKWWRFVRKEARLLQEFLQDHPMPVQGQGSRILNGGFTELPVDPNESTDTYRLRKRNHVARYFECRSSTRSGIFYSQETDKFEVLASRNKSAIMTWMALWPFSVLDTMFEDLIIRLWENLYTLLTGTFKRISEAVLAPLNPPSP